MKEVMIVLTMIGFDNGIMILEKTSHFVAPSTIAASSSAFGIVSKKPLDT